jgi:cobalt-zinc-cadmium efflux system outer membrane protein
MRVACTALALAGVVSMPPARASAQRVLTLDDVLTTARERAPQIVSAHLGLAEARGRVTGAGVRPLNPEVDVSAGPRRGDSRTTDLDVGLSQRFEPSGLRAARLAGANARLEEATASADETTRGVLRDAARAFYQAVFAAERIRLSTTAETLAAAVFDAADRRHRAGDIPVLDVNLARAALARARADRQAGEAEQAAALGALKALLQLDGAIAVQGSLVLGQPPDAAALARRAEDRPELRALEAAVRDAEAEVAMARSLSRLEFGLGVRYAREEGSRIVLGGVTVTLPVFAKGQEQLAVGSARASRLRTELEATRSRIRIELETALVAYEHRATAVRVLEADALPSLDENDALTARSFEVGQIGLPDLLLIRRELLETRALYLNTLLEAALARVEIDAAAAVLR